MPKGYQLRYTAHTMSQIFDYQNWRNRLPELRQKYVTAEPFPHLVLENFLNEQVLDQTLAEFPAPNSEDWITYRHVNSNKFGSTDRKTFPSTIGQVIDELNSPQFVQFISDLTGIPDLFADEALEGGGMHQSERGGFLNVHADFQAHTFHDDWRRRVNIIVYLNKNWEDSFGGHLELWDKQMTRALNKVAPIFNRVVIFNCDFDAFHGHPIPLACPPGMSRKSLALYYYTKEKEPTLVAATEYKARPQDSALKKVMIYLDKKALHVYDFLRRKLGINDKAVSKFLRVFTKK